MSQGNKDGGGLDRAQQYLANERTFLSWLRTSIALVGLGFIVARFGLFLREFQLLIGSDGTLVGSHFADPAVSSILGISMVGLGLALVLFAFKSYQDGNRQIESGIFVPKRGTVYAAAVLLAVFSVIIIMYLLVVSL